MKDTSRFKMLVVNIYMYIVAVCVFTVIAYKNDSMFMIALAIISFILTELTMGVTIRFLSADEPLSRLWLFIGFVLVIPGVILCGLLNLIFKFLEYCYRKGGDIYYDD